MLVQFLLSAYYVADTVQSSGFQNVFDKLGSLEMC